jgi:SAM-dependent methyltransferase
MMWAEDAIKKLVADHKFESVLDIGCGDGSHSDYFKSHNKQVTSTDYNSRYPGCVVGDYNTIKFTQFDCVWVSHVLEHQLNVNLFLKKIKSELVDNGIICVTVPPLKNEIVGGHVSIWNAGLLLYNLVLAGFDCKNCSIKSYGYNISVIARSGNFSLPDLKYDSGDIDRLRPWLPSFCKERFNGIVDEWNW